MLFWRNKLNKKQKIYLSLFFWLLIIISGLIYLWPSLNRQNVTKTLRIEKVYGANQGNGFPSGTACLLEQQCQNQDRCYTNEPVRCNAQDQCGNCDLGYGTYCGTWQGPQASGFCYAETATYPYFASCGVCGAELGGGGGDWSPQDCFDQMPNPTYRFAISNPAGQEKAYISAEGYLFMAGNGANDDNESIVGGIDGWMENYLTNWYCQAGDGTPAGVFRINNDQNEPIAAFIACADNGDLTLLLNEPYNPANHNDGITEFAQGDYNGSGNLVIKNSALGDLTSAWFDVNGALHLKACYSNNPND